MIEKQDKMHISLLINHFKLLKLFDLNAITAILHSIIQYILKSNYSV